MDQKQKDLILIRARKWFETKIATNHKSNTEKIFLNPEKELNLNPFLIRYLAKVIDGKITANSLAKAALYPRVLGTSITTSFGQNLQNFISESEMFKGYGSKVSGIDIEFTDTQDKRKKYCQVKLGPTTINKGDIGSIDGDFLAIKNLARTNNAPLQINDLVIGILFGHEDDVNAFYKTLRDKHHYTLLVGYDFWYRLTGDDGFYAEWINACATAADTCDTSGMLDDAVDKLSKTDLFKKMAADYDNESAKK